MSSLVDEFCKEYAEIVNKSLIGNLSKRPSIMFQSEIITIAIIFQLSGFRTFKHLYVFFVKTHMRKDYPALVSYTQSTET